MASGCVEGRTALANPTQKAIGSHLLIVINPELGFFSLLSCDGNTCAAEVLPILDVILLACHNYGLVCHPLNGSCGAVIESKGLHRLKDLAPTSDQMVYDSGVPQPPRTRANQTPRHLPDKIWSAGPPLCKQRRRGCFDRWQDVQVGQ